MKKMLIVDDNPGILSSLATGLGGKYDVSVAGDAFSALKYLKSGPFDVLLLDLLMPGLDGVGFTRALRDEGIGVPIIMMSASRHLELHAANLPVAACVRKPFELAALEASIEEVLGRDSRAR